jgi:hypothetical protein
MFLNFVQAASNLASNPRLPAPEKKDYSKVVTWVGEEISNRLVTVSFFDWMICTVMSKC